MARTRNSLPWLLSNVCPHPLVQVLVPFSPDVQNVYDNAVKLGMTKPHDNPLSSLVEHQ